MNTLRFSFIAALSGAALSSQALAQFTVTWSSIDCGGIGPNPSMAGGAFAVSGSVGQADAGALMSGGAFQASGGFWTVEAQSSCYANCDASTALPILNSLDFGCFLTKYAAGDTYANCDASSNAPILNALDFGCFLTKFAAGCT